MRTTFRLSAAALALLAAASVAPSWAGGPSFAFTPARGEAQPPNAPRAPVANGARSTPAGPTSAALRERLARAEASHPANVPDGTLLSVRYLLDLSDRLEDRFADKAPLYRRRAARYLDRIEAGHDPYVEEAGKITNRGYHNPASTVLQGYAIYLPPNYDSNRAYPVYVALHGGSSNGNLFLGVVLGNNMDWLTYDQHLWDEYTPRWSPDWIVVAPTGFGQMLWRWMAERDVLDVIADVQRHYHVDENQIVLGGLSNGGLGTYSIGMRNAWRFSSVMAMAGAPSWLQYAPCDCRGLERANIERYSGMHLTENSFNTDWRTYHGRTDTGPMRPAYVQAFEARVRELALPAKITWFDLGHDILYACHQHGNIYSRLAPTKRNPRPREVRVITGDYRANRQHWVTVTRIASYPELARVRAVVDGDTVTVETSNVDAFLLDLRDLPIESDAIKVVVDGNEAYSGGKAGFGHALNLVRRPEGFRPGFPEDPANALVKRPGLSGPIMDAYYERMVHVYGTQDAAATDVLKRAAERGARGWPLWAWDLRQEVVADTAVTDEMIAGATLVLYGTAGSNAVLERIRDRLPIRVDRDAIVVGERRFTAGDAGVRFIYPSPLAENRYVIVQGGVTKEAVANGNALPEFLPDFVVYDRRTTKNTQARMTGSRNPTLASGFFDARWQLRTTTASLPFVPLETIAGGDPSGRNVPWPSHLPVPPAPAQPPAPTTFRAAPNTPEGRAARTIATRVRGFLNYRATIKGATWSHDPNAAWSVRPASECLAELDRLGVPYRIPAHAPELIPVPVQVGGVINGVRFQMAAANRPFLVACELAAKLPRTAEILRQVGIVTVGVVSAYRNNPYTSFHTMGLALDIGSFATSDGVLRVVSDFALDYEHVTCEGPRPERPGARTLIDAACALGTSHVWSSVLTPNYNEGHRDHFHVDVRPDDPRFFLR